MPRDFVGPHHAARRIVGFDQQHLRAAPLEFARSCKSGDASADDQGVDVRNRTHAGARDRAASVKARTPATGVSGRQPCPRFST